jgi:hypothetical protein
MGVEVGDYDQDGRLDLLVTNFCSDHNTLYRATGPSGARLFEDGTDRADLGRCAYDKVCWGVGLRDFDHDGYLDIFLSTGHVYAMGDRYMTLLGGTYEQTPHLLLSTGPPRFRFVDASERSGPAFRTRGLGRAAAFADYDGDGDVDVAVARLNQRLQVLENRLEKRGRWVKVRLVGEASNRDGIGARVRVKAGAVQQLAEHRLAGSFGASQEACLHFGLGEAVYVDELTVTWPSGRRQVFANLPAEREYVVREGFEGKIPPLLGGD